MMQHIYTTDIIEEHMYMCSFLVWKNACLNYREFDLEDDLVGVPHTWYLSAQSFKTLLKFIIEDVLFSNGKRIFIPNFQRLEDAAFFGELNKELITQITDQ